MIRACATVTLIPELRGGPFLFADGLRESCDQAAAAGFDAVELVIPSADRIDPNELGEILTGCGLGLAAVSSGGGYLVHKLHLTCTDESLRRRAVNYINAVVDLAGPFGAVVIIGVMKGYLEAGVDRVTALGRLRDGLERIAPRAEKYGISLVLEPLNRYESNFINRLDEGVELIDSLGLDNIKLLADLFHMNIEEASVAGALREAGAHVGHVHFADSNRCPPGSGHTDFANVAKALQEIGYDGYLSVEVLPYPSAAAAAAQALRVMRAYWSD
jgi:sugar phosphate isomerase/epimerase